MSGRNPNVTQSIRSGEDLSAKQFYLARMNVADGTCYLVDAATDRIHGSIYDGGKASGSICSIDFGGFQVIYLGDTVTRGDYLTGDSTARAIKITAEGSAVYGMAMESGVVGDKITVDCTKASATYYQG